MADADFRASQWDQRYAPHIAPINEYIDSIREPKWLPYVAPMHGGIDARILTLLRDPGPRTQDVVGSGFLSIENDDPTAEQQGDLLAAVGLTARDVLPWNAYPWYINRVPKAVELELGIDPILELIRLATNLEVVLLQGGSARDSWRRLQKRAPRLVRDRGLTVIETYHPGRQALWHKDPAVRAERVAHQKDAFQQIAETLGANPGVPAK